MLQISTCEICHSRDFSSLLICKDYLVSGKEFSIVQCKNCGFKFTSPIPSQNEIAAYYESNEYISHTTVSKNIVDRVYKLIRNYTLKAKVQLVNSFNTQKNILDIGCGTGEFLNACTKNGWKTMGIEASTNARNYAKTKYSLHVEEGLSSILNTSMKFDVITLWHVLEHLHNLNEVVQQLKSLLKENGKIIVAVPNNNSYDAEIYKQYWAGYDVPRHLYHFTYNNIKQLFKKQELNVEKVLPMYFDSFYVSLLSEKYKRGKNNFVMAFITGGLSNMLALVSKNSWSSQIYIISRVDTP